MPFLGHPLTAVITTLKTITLTHVIFTYAYSPGLGSGPSMLPTFLATADWFVTDRRFRRGRGVSVGDCVTYAIPVEPGQEGVKRVLGLPGDYVLLNSPPDADLGVKGRGSRAIATAGENMIQVPKGHCYIVGDNLPWSRDSRDFGPLPMGLIKGKVVAKMSFDGWWPPNWFSKVESGLRSPPPTATGASHPPS
ncbi:Uu.00g090770.m01.CDS01 [Anthostomella pinea]|uniref:Mitochondrial inner membrane protease subunit n=1 Tax=Anthostomella pinea TaxID=933095 RepID=A0AAI8YK69_9PEZI|nr:Uu.00g090770.m01.CDS01 [Anthostomella pinea]